MPTPPPGSPHYVFRLPRSALRVAAIAFAIGLLLFVIVWWSGRDSGFYRVEAANTGQPLDELDPLPQPLPPGEGASDMPDAGAPSEPRPQLVEAPPPTVEQAPDAPDAPESSGPVQPGAGEAVAMAPGEQPVPMPGQTPAPRYPPAALRRGEGGTVLVRVEVDVRGMPAGVALVRQSGSRDLDRAAMEAVRQWRFRPGQRDGRPVAGNLVVPIDFTVD
ncbi:MAG TPA: TonB family protein [Pseudoxanthomonas sp.]|nr:TonB family protein [Pseudoxanthomonas sp.]